MVQGPAGQSAAKVDGVQSQAGHDTMPPHPSGMEPHAVPHVAGTHPASRVPPPPIPPAEPPAEPPAVMPPAEALPPATPPSVGAGSGPRHPAATKATHTTSDLRCMKPPRVLPRTGAHLTRTCGEGRQDISHELSHRHVFSESSGGRFLLSCPDVRGLGSEETVERPRDAGFSRPTRLT
jgi:hypothetical protein